MKRQNTSIDIWWICENPNCPLPDQVFLAAYSNKHRKYCSLSCSSSVIMTKLNNDPDFKNASRHRMITKNNDPKFRKIVDESQKTPKRRKQKSEQAKIQWADSKFQEFMSNMTKTMWKDPEYRKSKSEDMTNQILNGKFGRAQKLLFSELISKYPEVKPFLKFDKCLNLKESIREQYPLANKWFYKVDISVVINGDIKLAIEVDGKLGHSTDLDLKRDETRDKILLNEFLIPTIRVRNSWVIGNLQKTFDFLIGHIRSYIPDLLEHIN
jgi:hypothetical protein